MQTFNLTKVVLSLAVLTQLVSSEAFAKTKFREIRLTANKAALQDPYYQIKSTKIKELTNEEAMEYINEDTTKPKALDLILPLIPPMPAAPSTLAPTPATPAATPAAETPATGGVSPSGFFDGVIMVVDKLIAIGQKIIPTIEKGKAVVTNNPMSAISVLPRLDTKDPVVHEMGGWSLPVTKHYKISYKNGYGSEVISFVYSVSYQYNGKYGESGKYLTGIRASARSISVTWGFDLDASSQLIQISNVGTTKDIVAGATIEMSYTVKNWTRQTTNNVSFFIAGDGRLYKLD